MIPPNAKKGAKRETEERPAQAQGMAIPPILPTPAATPIPVVLTFVV